MTWIKAHRRTVIVLALLPAVVWFYSAVLAARGTGGEFPSNVPAVSLDVTAVLLFGGWTIALAWSVWSSHSRGYHA